MDEVKALKIIVIGQGYVGLPLSISASKAGFEVTGIDINAQKISQINERKSPVEDISDSEINTAII
jgi:UDP-N-acetyl-D-glucosamine dehydrogenase